MNFPRPAPAFAAAALGLALSACSSQPQPSARGTTAPAVALLPNVDPKTAPGVDVQRAIDTRIARRIHLYDPALTVGPSQCQANLDLSAGKTATCYLPVNGDALAIHVAYVGPPLQYKVDFGGAAFFEMSQVDRYIALYFRRTRRVEVTAHCAGPAIQVLPAGAAFDCAMSGLPNATKAHVQTLAHGVVQIQPKA